MVDKIGNNRVRFVNLITVLGDNDGFLKGEFDSGDGLHMTPSAYRAVAEYLLDTQVHPYITDFELETEGENTEGEGYLRVLFDQLKGEPALGFCLDTGHEYCYNYAKDLLAEYGPLTYIHVNDNLGITGDSIFWLDDAHLIPYDGIVDFDRVARRLAKLGFTDTLTCEMTTASKPGRNTHDIYADLSCEE